ncbi:hypothetical protein OKA04_03555 [Luteolibacter flavescens]|uniref:NACHT domain-containing protein n=1 Tax=Luteolibacter flavescens TaxID=1859460 RepID=A0ABT3FKS6_9BACT|nr:hypothetical protein [Luteolibacter flavescens]MCW1883789.1 hypothetical protein [Luteolibacter flavescens]
MPWTRFWSPRKDRVHGTSSQFFEDPHGLFGKNLHPQAVTISQIAPETGLLVLCGEPGLGKTTELELLRDGLMASSGPKDRLIFLKARDFESIADFQSHLEGHPFWPDWLSDGDRLTILLDGLDEGLILMPAFVTRLKPFLESKPTDRLRLILSCRSFEWPEAEGNQLASLWKREENTGFIFELEPLRREDARLAAEQKGHDGDKFIEAVHRADVASLASRPITLFLLLAEFHGEEFHTVSRRQLYKNGCRRLCEESNPERARLLRRFCSTDEKLDASGKLACGLLLGGKNAIWHPSTRSPEPSGNICGAADLIRSGLLLDNSVDHSLATGLFTALGGDCFGFTHQTFAECLAAQSLSKLPLSQLRNLLCATDPADGAEYVIPQLVELAAWVAGDHSGFFAHLVEIDLGVLLRSGVAYADPEQKAKLVERIFDLAGRNQFFDESGYWRFWSDLDHPGLPGQLINILTAPFGHSTVRRIAVDIAEACRRSEMVPTLLKILESEEGDQYFRRSVADALCSSMPDDRLAELESLVRGEVGSDPDQSILGHALQRLVPAHLSVTDVLRFIGKTKDPNHFGSYWRALEELPKHIMDHDVLPGLRAIQAWRGGFSSTSFRRKLCMAFLLWGLSRIDEPAICEELVKLWTDKASNFREFFRTGAKDDDDFAKMEDESRLKWVAAIINSPSPELDDRIDHLTWETYRLIKQDDFCWVLDNLLSSGAEAAPRWAEAVQRMIWDEKVRIASWDEFITAYRCSPQLQDRMKWIEEVSIDTPSRRSEKAGWLWRERRFERIQNRRPQVRPKLEIENAIAKISGGESWAFINLCWALSLDETGRSRGFSHHEIVNYPGWSIISDQEKEFVSIAARRFLMERSDGWEEMGCRTNYFDPGVVAIWMLRGDIESDDALCKAVETKWIEAILGIWDSSSEHAKELFALAYRINPVRAINGWIREVRRACERDGHPFAIRRAQDCFDEILAKELINLFIGLKHSRTVSMAIYELREFDETLSGELAAYLLSRALRARRPDHSMVEELIIAGIGTNSRSLWRSAYQVLSSQPELGKRVILSVADGVELRNKNVTENLTEDEIADFYLLLCRLFPHSEDPAERSGEITPRRAVTHLRSGILDSLAGRSNRAACSQLRRLAVALPDQATWLLRRCQQTLSSFRRNEWQPPLLSNLAAVLLDDRMRFVRDSGDLMNLVLESLDALQRHLKGTTLPAVEDLWQWESGGLRRANFRHKDEEAVSDYIARWLRDRIGQQSRVVVNREVQPRRGLRTDILVEAWSLVPEKPSEK